MKKYKEVIRFFVFLLLLVCLVPLLYGLIVIIIEGRADNYANTQIQVTEPAGLSTEQQLAFRDSVGYLRRASRKYYLDSVQYKPLIKADYYGKYGTYYYCHEHGIKFDFGRKTAVKLVVAISSEDALRSAANNNRDSIFSNAVASEGGDLQKKYDAAIRETFHVISKRLNQVSAQPPKMALNPQTKLLTIEIDGVDDPVRVHKLITQVGQVGFWNTYEISEVIHYLDEANSVLRDIAIDETALPTKKVDTVAAATKDTDSFTDIIGNKAEAVRGKVKNPLFELLYPNISQYGQSQTLGEGPMIGRAFGKDTAGINQLLGVKQVRAIFPPELKLLWSAHPVATHTNIFGLYAIKRDRLLEQAPITGEWITDAYKSFDGFGTPEVDFTMNSYGASAWERMTGQAAYGELNGKRIHRCIAIVIDDVVFSAPRVMQKIAGGRSQITGIEDIEEADDLAIIIKSGKLQAKTRIIEEHTSDSSSFMAWLQKGLVFTGIIGILMSIGAIIYYTVKDEEPRAQTAAHP